MPSATKSWHCWLDLAIDAYLCKDSHENQPTIHDKQNIINHFQVPVKYSTWHFGTLTLWKEPKQLQANVPLQFSNCKLVSVPSIPSRWKCVHTYSTRWCYRRVYWLLFFSYVCRCALSCLFLEQQQQQQQDPNSEKSGLAVEIPERTSAGQII